MGDALVTYQWVYHGRIDAAQADVGASGRSQRPGVGPAVAVEHRQGPGIDRIAAESKGQHVADGIQIGAAVMVDDALGVAGGARGVEQRDRPPFVGGIVEALGGRSEEHTSELQSLMRISYAVFCLKKKKRI